MCIQFVHVYTDVVYKCGLYMYIQMWVSSLHIRTCAYRWVSWVHVCTQMSVQGGEDSWDPLSLQVIFRKSDRYLVALLWKIICNLGDPMSLCHPVLRGHTHVGACTLVECGWVYIIFTGHFPQKWPIVSGSFVENNLQLRGSYVSSPPCTACTYACGRMYPRWVWMGVHYLYKSFSAKVTYI